jgi:hypothetical protein
MHLTKGRQPFWALLQRCLDAQSSHSMPLLLCFLLMRQNLSLSLVVVRLLTSIIVDLVIVLGPRAISARAFFQDGGVEATTCTCPCH